jgi:thiamine-phosphate pyrophosphorylase
MDLAAVRIVDANLNRAREALRVIEDYARFARGAAEAAAAAKQMRHELRELADALGRETRLTFRDSAADVGRALTTEREQSRTDLDDVVAAAFGRLTEAARSIAEYGKLLDPQLAARAEALRFQAYGLEQRIVLRAGLLARFRVTRLYVLITAAQCRGDWRAAAEAVISAGRAMLQLREKALPDGELLRRARLLRELTRPRDALLFINDRPDIARLADADGVHVGQDDLCVREVRSIVGARMLIGKSTHSVAQVEAALAEGPDYIAVGPMHRSATKPQEHIPGPALLSQAAKLTALPLVAIGGITPENAGELYRAGASCVCACSAILGAADPAAAVRQVLDSA